MSGGAIPTTSENNESGEHGSEAHPGATRPERFHVFCVPLFLSGISEGNAHKRSEK